MERKAFENNQVLLWGIKPVKKSLLEEFDKGNKNPNSIVRKKEPKIKETGKKETVKKEPVKRVFSMDEDYGTQDLPFLNKEYERIDNEMSKPISMEEMDELTEQQDKLYELIEGLEALQKMGGRGCSQPNNYDCESESESDSDNDHYNIKEIVKKLLGKGFKKGSPEALAHAVKMRKAREDKRAGIVKEVVVKQTSKARVVKGSNEAKELAQKLVEAKKKKKTEAPKEEKVKPVKKGKPWFYIGDIPRGYREATEDEAIIKKKISEYGKRLVDKDKWELYNEYDILLTTDKNDRDIIWYMNGLKKRIMSSLQEVEILEAKLENKKYESKREANDSKLVLEKRKRKYLQAGWNWYHKLLCERTGKKYERQKFELPKREIDESQLNVKDDYKSKFVRPIDPRTGKPAEYSKFDYSEKPEVKHKGDIDVELYFENGGDIIKLSTKYFTPDYKLKPKYSEKLLKKGYILKRKHYTTADYDKYFYGMKGGNIGYGIISELIS